MPQNESVTVVLTQREFTTVVNSLRWSVGEYTQIILDKTIPEDIRSIATRAAEDTRQLAERIALLSPP